MQVGVDTKVYATILVGMASLGLEMKLTFKIGLICLSTVHGPVVVTKINQ